jgi:hypothetical protein
MSDFFAGRAMEIARLDETQIRQIHATEKIRGYCLFSCDIQRIFKLPSLKEQYGIPEDQDALRQHYSRVSHFLNEQGLFRVEGDQSVFSKHPEEVHSFDWGVWHKNICSEFYYAGPQKKGSLIKAITNRFG